MISVLFFFFFTDFNATDALDYIDGLLTFRSIVDAFSKQSDQNNWNIIGSDLSVGSNEAEVRFYSELSQFLIGAVGWTQ